MVRNVVQKSSKRRGENVIVDEAVVSSKSLFVSFDEKRNTFLHTFCRFGV